MFGSLYVNSFMKSALSQRDVRSAASSCVSPGNPSPWDRHTPVLLRTQKFEALFVWVHVKENVPLRW